MSQFTYTLCDTPEAASAAIAQLSSAALLFLDCEGRSIGSANGALSLIQVGAPNFRSAYLFDALVLPRQSLQPLLELLAAENPKKVVWDGRMDYVELLHGTDTRLAGVLDLQLVDVASRALRGETDYRRLGRLGRLDFPVSEVQKLQHEGLNGLSSLDSALRDHNVGGVAPKASKCFFRLPSKLWLT